MKLSDIVPEGPIQVWVPFEPIEGFEVLFEHKDATQRQKIFRKAQVLRWNPKTHQKEEDIDVEKMNWLVATEIVKDWRGLTPRKLAKIVPVDFDRLKDAGLKPDDEIPYDPEDCVFLLTKSDLFDSFVADTMTKVAEIAAEQRSREVKNSKRSPRGTSSAKASED